MHDKLLVAAYLLNSSSRRAPPLKAPSHCRKRRPSKRYRGQHLGVKFETSFDQQREKAKDGSEATERKHAGKKREQSLRENWRRSVTEGELRSSGIREKGTAATVTVCV